MNLWIIKYDTETFSKQDIENLESYTSSVSQLASYKKVEFSKGNFYFLSIHSEGIPKSYNNFDENVLKGYSGLLIDKSPLQTDLRDARNVKTENPNLYYGQFALYNLKEGFSCFADNLGFHKVFYGQKDGKIYVSNSFEFIKRLNVFQTNVLQMLKDFSTVRFGIFPGYNTLLRGVFTLPEYGYLEISSEGNINVKTYKNISELLSPDVNFESKMKEAVHDYKTIAAYLRKYHKVAIGLSGGFDGRLILNMFHGTSGKSLETFTYNRAGNLDLKIASLLSRKTKVFHHKVVLKTDVKVSELKVSGFKDSAGDPFTISLKKAMKNFYKADGEYKVVLGGNGGDTDWEFGEKRIADVDKSSLKTFIRDYSGKLSDHPLLNPEIKQIFAKEMESYFWKKYQIFEIKNNYQQLLASAFFHLERFRGEQGFGYSQNANKYHDIFAPFAIESFNQLVFLATKRQLQRGLREGIQYRLSKELTEGKIPYAPILTSANEHGNNFIQNSLNKIAPYLPKIIWKLNKGDTNTRIRKNYQNHVNQMYKEYISENMDSEVFQYINRKEVLDKVSKSDYNGNYNTIGSMIKTIKE